jgi:hypothetical protein
VESEAQNSLEEVAGRTVMYELACEPTIGSMENRTLDFTRWTYSVDSDSLSRLSTKTSTFVDVFTFRCVHVWVCFDDARVTSATGARPIIRNPENKKFPTLLGYRFTLTSTMSTVG